MNIVERNIDRLIREYFDNYMDFKENLEKLLNRQIDLLENQAIRNPFSVKLSIETKN